LPAEDKHAEEYGARKRTSDSRYLEGGDVVHEDLDRDPGEPPHENDRGQH
jgi:hypothetical protein